MEAGTLDILEKLELLFLETAGDDEDNETDAQAADRAEHDRKVRTGQIARPEDPDALMKGGHKRHVPYDMSTDEKPYSGDVAPKLAGERQKALSVLGRVKGFIEKYHELAVDKFYGTKGPGGKRAEYQGSKGLKLGRAPTPQFGTAKDTRAGKVGNVRSTEQVMSKEKALSLLDSLPMMDSEKMMYAVHAVGNYVWRIHAQARADIRAATQKRLRARENFPHRQKLNQKTGEMEDTDKLDTDHPAFKEHLEAMSREFEQDSMQIKGDINLLMSSSGMLKKAGGFGGDADKKFLEKIVQGYVDDEGNWRIKKTGVYPQEPAVAIPPGELEDLAGGDYKAREAELEDRPKQRKSMTLNFDPEAHHAWAIADDDAPKKRAPSDAGPMLKRGGGSTGTPRASPLDMLKRGGNTSVDPKDLPDHLPKDWLKDEAEWKLGKVIEQACADRTPQWWDEL
jgi:hypothetical protein